MKINVSILLLLISTICIAKEKSIYLDNGFIKCKKRDATYIQTFYPSIKDKNLGKYEIKLIDGTIVSKYEGKGLYGDPEEGELMTYYLNGQLNAHIVYKDKLINGTLRSYYINGQLRREDKYIHGEFKEGKCFTKSGADTTHFIFQKLASFPGGEDSLRNYTSANLKYPELAMRYGLRGVVGVQFQVEITGEITNIKVVRKITPPLDDEAFSFIKNMPNWEPSILEGKKEVAIIILPITFKLE